MRLLLKSSHNSIPRNQRAAAVTFGASLILIVVCSWWLEWQVWVGQTSRNLDQTSRRLQVNATVAPTDEFAYHKDLFPLDERDYIALIFCSAGLLVAAGGGIGGGGIIVPLYMLILKFRPKHAIPLSNITIMGGAIANALFNCPKRHPNANRPVIDWDLILVMEPTTIAGAVVGSFLSKFLPDIVLTVMLCILLALMGWRTTSKGCDLYAEETAKIEEEEERGFAMEDEDSQASVTRDLVLNENTDGDTVEGEEEEDDDDDDLIELREAEESTPWLKVFWLFLCFVGCIILTLLKGSGHMNPLEIECGSGVFWTLSLSQIPWVLAFAAGFRCLLLQSTQAKHDAGWKFGPDDIEWNEDTTVRYPIICTAAGLFAGLFGVGGGIVKGPLMLEMGVAPVVASATAATMILFTTAAASVSFMVFGLVDWEYAIALFVLGFVCTVIGQAGLNVWMKEAKRQSPIVLSIGSVILASSILVCVESISNIMSESIEELMKPDSLCSNGSER